MRATGSVRAGCSACAPNVAGSCGHAAMRKHRDCGGVPCIMLTKSIGHFAGSQTAAPNTMKVRGPASFNALANGNAPSHGHHCRQTSTKLHLMVSSLMPCPAPVSLASCRADHRPQHHFALYSHTTLEECYQILWMCATAPQHDQGGPQVRNASLRVHHELRPTASACTHAS